MTYKNRIKRALTDKEKTAGQFARQINCTTQTAERNLLKLCDEGIAERTKIGNYFYYKKKGEDEDLIWIKNIILLVEEVEINKK